MGKYKVSIFAVLALNATPGHTWQPYAGINLGMQASMHDAHIRDTVDTFNPGLNKISAFFGAVAGIQQTFNSHWFIGLEIDGYLGQNKTTFDQNTEAQGSTYQPVQLSVERSSVAGLSFRIGYQHENFAPYIRFGTEYSQFQIKMQGASVDITNRINGDKDLTAIAFAPGLGIDIKLTENLILNFDTRYALYKSKTANFYSSVGDHASVTLKPRIASFNIGCRWLF